MLNRRGIALAALGLAAALVAGCTSQQGRFVTPNRSAAQDIITPEAAEKVVRDTWAARQKAYAAPDRDAAAQELAAVTEGAAMHSDLTVITFNLARRKAGATVSPPRDLTTAVVAVTRQREYPAGFVAFTSRPIVNAAGRTTGTRNDIELYAQRAAATPWRLQATAVLPTGVRPPPLAGSAQAFREPDAAAADPANAALDRLRTAANTAIAGDGKLPKDAGLTTNRQFDTLLNGFRLSREYYREQLVTEQATLIGARSVVPVPPPLPVAGGWFTVAALPLRRTFTAATVCQVQSADRRQWSQALAPGSYASITMDEVLVVALVKPPGGAAPVVIAADSSTASASGVACEGQ